MSGRLSRQELDSKLNEEITRYGVAESSNNKVITLSHFPNSYVDGTSIAFKNTFANTAAVTINVNGLGAKTIKKSNGADIPSGFFKPGGIYTIRYNSTNGNFILQGEGGEIGTATANDVVAPKTIGVESGLVTGTIIDKNNLNGDITPTHHSPAELSAVPGTLYVRPNGVGGNQRTVYTGDIWLGVKDPNFLAANILGGKTLFGLTGGITNYGRAALGQGYTSPKSYKSDSQGSLVVEPNTGYYEQGLNANGYGSIIIGDPNFVPSSIIAGKTVLGVSGTGTPGSAFTATPGDLVLVDSLPEKSNNTTTFTKVKDIQVNFKGIVRVKFDFRSYTNNNVEGAVYKNGVRVGIVRLVWVNTNATFSEDFTVAEGDYIQLYIRGQAAASTALASNFRICVAQDPLSTVILA